MAARRASRARSSCCDATITATIAATSASAISFDQIPEMDDYIAMQHGLPKRKESLKWFLDYIAGMKSKYGKVYVRYGKPVALGEPTGLSEGMLDQSDQQRNPSRSVA